MQMKTGSSTFLEWSDLTLLTSLPVCMSSGVTGSLSQPCRTIWQDTAAMLFQKNRHAVYQPLISVENTTQKHGSMVLEFFLRPKKLRKPWRLKGLSNHPVFCLLKTRMCLYTRIYIRGKTHTKVQKILNRSHKISSSLLHYIMFPLYLITFLSDCVHFLQNLNIKKFHF